MTELVRTDNGYMPVLSLQQAIDRRNAIVEFTQKMLKADIDYGIVPNTIKPTLLKPGAEKLCTQFGLAPVFERLDCIRDWTGQMAGGEPLFSFEYRCRLYRNGVPVGEGIGSCNSWEKKYRYRKAERLCPACGASAIIKGKQDYGGGWLCFSKKGGCNAKYPDNEPAITQQEVGHVPNPDIFDIVNTIDKMAQKRALIAATLIALNASEFFTQDMETQYIEDGASYQEPQTRQDKRKTPERQTVVDRIRERWAEEKHLGGNAPSSELAVDLDTANVGDLIEMGQRIRSRVDRLRLKQEQKSPSILNRQEALSKYPSDEALWNEVDASSKK